MTERVRSQVQVAKMVFLQKVKGLSLLDKVKRTDICQSLNIKPQMLGIERSQLHWYDQVTQMSHEQTAKQLMDALPSCKRLREQPRTHWWNYVKDLAWSCLGIPPAKLPLVAGDWDAWRSQLKLLPPQLQKDKQAKGNALN